MRKWSNKISLWIVTILSLTMMTGCKKTKIHLLVPTGGPQYATAYLQKDASYEMTVVSGAEALTAGFNDIGYDVIIAPVNLGAKMFQAKPNYPLIGVITWGNYYLISESTIDLSQMNRLEVIAFGENQIPDFLIQFIFDHYNLEVDITYLDSVAAIAGAYILDSSKVYLIAEPSMSVLETKKSLQYIDLQAEYQAITGSAGFPQAGVFAKKGLSDSQVQSLVSDLIASTTALQEDPKAYEHLTSLGIELPKVAFQNAMLRSNLVFKDANTSKPDLVALFTQIMAFNPNFIGKIPDETFYR